ncbi:hypothetical protein BCV70DRAFT_19129 [Testicularia cyperi]|uniref:Uncharacterized protein n=1 Tax=Testicularia cyperi TaxID=1882483 RepID=A0A317XZ30_9BASI|nr:hypothetical protein BCV70DRAFT_19129 [Testicularia cyperi]
MPCSKLLGATAYTDKGTALVETNGSRGRDRINESQCRLKKENNNQCTHKHTPSTVQYSTVQYSTVQYSTVQYSTVQYSTVQYNTILAYRLHPETCQFAGRFPCFSLPISRSWALLFRVLCTSVSRPSAVVFPSWCQMIHALHAASLLSRSLSLVSPRPRSACLPLACPLVRRVFSPRLCVYVCVCRFSASFGHCLRADRHLARVRQSRSPVSRPPSAIYHHLVLHPSVHTI